MEEDKIIGLAGFKRSGKDTAAQALVRAGWKRVAFADALREEVRALYPAAASIPDAAKDEPHPDLGGRSLRDLLIEHGMRRREEDPDYWVKIAEQKIRSCLSAGHSVVVTDVRMDNEWDMLRSLGALMVWVARPGVEGGNHITERDLRDRADIVVNNNATIEALERKMMGILGGRCGACVNMRRDKSYPRYGFCQTAQSLEEKARLADIASRCFMPGLFVPAKGFVPPSRP